MGEEQIDLEAQRKHIKRYEDFCALGALFSLLLLFNDGPAKIVGYAIGIFGWFWWANRAKRTELERQIHQREHAQTIAAEIAARGDESLGKHFGTAPEKETQGHTAEQEQERTGFKVSPHPVEQSVGCERISGKECPKCGHRRATAEDAHVPEWQCPACGIAYAKFKPMLHAHTAPATAEHSTARRVSAVALRAIGWCLVVAGVIFITVVAVTSKTVSDALGLILGILILFGLTAFLLLFLGSSIGAKRSPLTRQWRGFGHSITSGAASKSKENRLAQLGIAMIGIVMFGHVSLALMYGTMAPCRAASKRIVEASYEALPAPRSAAEQLGRQRGQSWTQGVFERLVYADMAAGSVLQCYAVAFRVASPVSRSERK